MVDNLNGPGVASGVTKLAPAKSGLTQGTPGMTARDDPSPLAGQHGTSELSLTRRQAGKEHAPVGGEQLATRGRKKELLQVARRHFKAPAPAPAVAGRDS